MARTPHPSIDVSIYPKQEISPEQLLIREVLMTYAADIRLIRMRHIKGIICKREMNALIHELLCQVADPWTMHLCDLCGSDQAGLLRALSLLASCSDEALQRMRVEQFIVVNREPAQEDLDDESTD